MANTIRSRIRILHGTEIALGPGKVELLEAIERTGTLAEAARSLDMSYMRAWKLLQTMNACFRQPLVNTSRGGTGHGRATLTEAGHMAVALYRRMEQDSLRAIEPAWRALLEQLAD